MTDTPTKHIADPAQSYASGILRSIPQPHSKDKIMKTPHTRHRFSRRWENSEARELFRKEKG